MPTMLFKCAIVILVLCTFVDCQSRPRRQGVKGGSQDQQQKEYAPAPTKGKGSYQQPARQQQEEEEAAGGNSVVEGGASPEPAGIVLPVTSFTCEGKPYEPGMYADVETDCQFYHVCHNSRKDSFMCGMGTMFNQALLTCDFPHNTDCANTASFYSANAELGKASPEPASGGGQAPGARPPPPGASAQRSAGKARPQPAPQRPDYAPESDSAGPSYQGPAAPARKAPAPARQAPSKTSRPAPPAYRPPAPPAPSKARPAPAQGKPQPAYRPPAAAGKTSPPRQRPEPPKPIVQVQEDAPVDDSWLAEEPSSQYEQQEPAYSQQQQRYSRQVPSWQIMRRY